VAISAANEAGIQNTDCGADISGSIDNAAPATGTTEKNGEKTKVEVTGDDEDEPSIILGLKVYTKQDCVVVITGKLPHEESSAIM